MNYEQFSDDWKLRHKASLPRKRQVSSASEIFWIIFWVLVAIGAAIYSAAHTIPIAEMTIDPDVIGRKYISLTIFIIVELVIFGASAKRHEIKWLKWLLLAALTAALSAMIGSSSRAVTNNKGDDFTKVVGIIVTVITPLTALAAGEVVHLELQKTNTKRVAEDNRYKQEWKDTEAKINSAYKTYEKQQTNTNSDLFVTDKTNRQTDKQVFATNRTNKQGKQIALDYLIQNEGKYTVRELASLAGVTADAAHKGLKMFADQQSSNGHTKELEL